LIDIPGTKILAHSQRLNQNLSDLNSDYSDRLLEQIIPISSTRTRIAAHCPS
jgi:hypothetical protein